MWSIEDSLSRQEFIHAPTPLIPIQEVLDRRSSFVCRIQDNYACEVIEERPITADGKAAGVVRDRIVRLGSNATSGKIAGAVRVVEIKCRQHVKRMHTREDLAEQPTLLP